MTSTASSQGGKSNVSGLTATATVLLLATCLVAGVQSETLDDPYLWLEDATSEKALLWVKQQNAKTQSLLESRPGFEALHERLRSILTSQSRIPVVEKRGPWLYNFWRDEARPRGIWRRTTLKEFRNDEPSWDVLLDIGKLSVSESEQWVWKGATCLYPKYYRCLVFLSRGGGDEVVVREFDVETRRFVKNGFESPEARQSLAWRDANTVYIARNFDDGTLTRAGYPRVLKLWKRGSSIAEAKTIYEGKDTDVGVWPEVINEKGRRYERFARVLDVVRREQFIRQGEHWVQLEVPVDADVEMAGGWLFVRVRTDWTLAGRTFRAGSLVAEKLDEFLAGKRDFEVVFEPAERQSLEKFVVTKGFLILDVLDNVKGQIFDAYRARKGWVLRKVPMPGAASIDLTTYDRDEGDNYWLRMENYIEPTSLFLAKASTDIRVRMKSLPEFFDAKALEVRQYEAVSRDGTVIPYFVILRRDVQLDGTNPTILTGYGGFGSSMIPDYNGPAGAAWLEQGGIWVEANTRGGGEFGPEWHLVAQREGKQRANEDFIAVSEDLIRRRITSPQHLGIVGMSQGGLLVGAALTQRPDLYRAAVCMVPLLDMQRYSKLLVGASWIGEYGDPDDPKDWEFISKYSPYQNVEPSKRYPKVLFTTSTRDDRVHPAHARKMFAKMKDQGHDVLFYEYTEGGHVVGDPVQQAYTWALVYTFFREELK